MADLVGSTVSSAKLGVEANVKRIEQFIRFTQQALRGRGGGSGHFLKEIGDASLLVFSSFNDVLSWRQKLIVLLRRYNQRLAGSHVSARRLSMKVVVHIGEVAFGKSENPIALAVNQIFKIEKSFRANEFGCTEVVRRTLIPRVSAGELKAQRRRRITLPGEAEPSYIWRLTAKIDSHS